MEETKDEEILKRKRIRKNLLLKVNDEIKQISESKPSLLINSKTMDELGKVYTRSNILLIEKGIIYSNYIKTKIIIFPEKKIKPIYREKSVKNKVEKTNYNLEINGPSYEEEMVSPVIDFIPKKINLGAKKITVFDKRYTKNNGSIQKFIENNLNVDDSITKEDQLNKSLRIEKSNINKLIGKILIIKNNENMESIIKSNIKKLRKYCYKFRIKKKKRKNKSQEHKHNLNVNSSKKISVKKQEKERKSTPFKVIPHPSNKKQKKYSFLNIHRKIKKLKTLYEEDEKNIKNEQIKTKASKPVKTSEKIDTNNKSANNSNKTHYIIKINNSEDEPAPDLHNIRRELMRSVIYERPSKYSIYHNSKFSDKKKKIKKKNIKKMIMRKVSAFNPKDIEKIKFSLKKMKRDKFELEDNLNKSSINNSHNNSPHKSENKNENNNINLIINNSFNQSLSNIKKINSKKKKSKKKLIESPKRRIDNYSNCNTNNNTNIFTLTQSSNEKKHKIIRKKSYFI